MELHLAAGRGSTKRTLAVLSRGEIDIDQRDHDQNGSTPLMMAATFGHPQVVTVLLNKGANVSITVDDGATALHCSAQGGYLAATKLLVKASANLEAKLNTTGYTPLQLAAQYGHSEIMGVLIEAGAKPNMRALDGSTSLHMVATTSRWR